MTAVAGWLSGECARMQTDTKGNGKSPGLGVCDCTAHLFTQAYAARVARNR